MTLSADIEDLIARAYLSQREWKRVAREVRYLPADVPPEKLVELIKLIENEDERTELAISLSKLLDKMPEKSAKRVLEALMEEGELRIAGLVASNLSNLDSGLALELVRRLLESEDDESQQAGLLLSKRLISVARDDVEEVIIGALCRKPEGFADKVQALTSLLGRKRFRELLKTAWAMCDDLRESARFREALGKVFGETFIEELDSLI